MLDIVTFYIPIYWLVQVLLQPMGTHIFGPNDGHPYAPSDGLNGGPTNGFLLSDPPLNNPPLGDSPNGPLLCC